MPFDAQPVLSGTLVELRPLRPEDHAGLQAVAADPRIWEQHPVRDRHQEARFREFFAEALASGGALLATDAGTGQVIGSSRFHGYSEERSEVEIGWTFLARSHWGGRHNAEMKRLMLRHAFRFVDSVLFFVGAENLRSQRAVEKIGGVLEPERDAQGRLVYRIKAADFRAGVRAVGSCACGRVIYELRGDLVGPVTYCHCWRCRKHSGSSFGTTAGVRASDFCVVAGVRLLSSWESSPGVRRFFASCCGSPIYKVQQAAPEFLGLRLGTLDTDPGRKAEIHFMVGSKAPWVEVHDSLPQETGGVPFGERD